MENRYRGTKQFFLIYAELITAARYHGTVTYQHLANLIGLPPRGSHMGAELGGYLGTISEDEVQYGRPMLSAITINVEGRPGSGFFQLAKELGKLTSDESSDQSAFWEAEKAAVYKAWN